MRIDVESASGTAVALPVLMVRTARNLRALDASAA
jgi:hypothetical protein